jgi:uncharacterized MAPEG superfamily protein
MSDPSQVHSNVVLVVVLVVVAVAVVALHTARGTWQLRWHAQAKPRSHKNPQQMDKTWQTHKRGARAHLHVPRDVPVVVVPVVIVRVLLGVPERVIIVTAAGFALQNIVCVRDRRKNLLRLGAAVRVLVGVPLAREAAVGSDNFRRVRALLDPGAQVGWGGLHR